MKKLWTNILFISDPENRDRPNKTFRCRLMVSINLLLLVMVNIFKMCIYEYRLVFYGQSRSDETWVLYMPLTTTFNDQSVGQMIGDTALSSLRTFEGPEASHLYTPTSIIRVLLKRELVKIDAGKNDPNCSGGVRIMLKQ